MERILMVAFWGNMFLFKNNLSQNQYIELQAIADSEQFRNELDINDHADFHSKFIVAAKNNLNITLEPIKISHIIRMPSWSWPKQ